MMSEAMNGPTEAARERKGEAAALGGGGSVTGLGVWFVSEVGDWPSCPVVGGGDEDDDCGEGGDALLFLFLSASTITVNFSFFRQLSLLPLMKKWGPDWFSLNTVWPSENFA